MALTLVPLNDSARLFLAEHPEHSEAAVIRLYRDTDRLRSDLDELAIRVDALVRERAHIVEVLRTFYRAPLADTHIHAVLQLAMQLDPTLAASEQLRLKESE